MRLSSQDDRETEHCLLWCLYFKEMSPSPQRKLFLGCFADKAFLPFLDLHMYPRGRGRVYKYQFSQGNVLRKVKEEKVSLSYINREGSFFFNLIGYEVPKPKFPQGWLRSSLTNACMCTELHYRKDPWAWAPGCLTADGKPASESFAVSTNLRDARERALGALLSCHTQEDV